jgi:hypothetical protein
MIMEGTCSMLVVTFTCRNLRTLRFDHFCSALPEMSLTISPICSKQQQQTQHHNCHTTSPDRYPYVVWVSTRVHETIRKPTISGYNNLSAKLGARIGRCINTYYQRGCTIIWRAHRTDRSLWVVAETRKI